VITQLSCQVSENKKKAISPENISRNVKNSPQQKAIKKHKTPEKLESK